MRGLFKGRGDASLTDIEQGASVASTQQATVGSGAQAAEPAGGPTRTQSDRGAGGDASHPETAQEVPVEPPRKEKKEKFHSDPVTYIFFDGPFKGRMDIKRWVVERVMYLIFLGAFTYVLFSTRNSDLLISFAAMWRQLLGVHASAVRSPDNILGFLQTVVRDDFFQASYLENDNYTLPGIEGSIYASALIGLVTVRQVSQPPPTHPPRPSALPEPRPRRAAPPLRPARRACRSA